MILGIQKQPTADTIHLTRSIESALADLRNPAGGWKRPRLRSARRNFIEASISTLRGKLIGASVFIATILFFSSAPAADGDRVDRHPVSIFATALVFQHYGLSINTMTLGGWPSRSAGWSTMRWSASRTLRRLKEDRAKHHDPHASDRTGRGNVGRSAILYATIIVVPVFPPLFALPGHRGRLFVHRSGIASCRSRLDAGLDDRHARLAPNMLPTMVLDHGDGPLVAWLKAAYRNPAADGWTGCHGARAGCPGCCRPPSPCPSSRRRLPAAVQRARCCWPAPQPG